MSTVAETLQNAARRLETFSDSPRLDAELLLGSILGLSRSGLVAHSEEPVASERERDYATLVDRRSRGAPVAYLTGTREFWSLALKVTPAVLVPRPETELLVELALQHCPRDLDCTVLDLGTGSGAIAVAIASERPRTRVTGVDISPAALDIAMQNSRSLGLPHIEWRLGSWFTPVLGERFDLVVANPPYVASVDPVLETLSAEPVIALESGPSGLEALSAIISGAAAHLRAPGWLLLEHGQDQGPEVARLFERRGFSSIRTHSDFSGKPRVTLGAAHSQPQETS